LCPGLVLGDHVLGLEGHVLGLRGHVLVLSLEIMSLALKIMSLALEVVFWPCPWRSCLRIGLVVHIFTFSRSPSGLDHGLGCKSVFFGSWKKISLLAWHEGR